MADFTNDTCSCAYRIDTQYVVKRAVLHCVLARFTMRNGPNRSLKWAETQKPLHTDVAPSLPDPICDIGKSGLDTGAYGLNVIVIK